MATYEVTVEKTVITKAKITIEANGEDEADAKAYDLAQDRPEDYEWELEDDEIEVTEVLEDI